MEAYSSVHKLQSHSQALVFFAEDSLFRKLHPDEKS